ncbi:BnaA05g11930D [Brassica napus]|uniref:BnaA05g11930D protein n=1 Tax=Brassica napus TaxID=3708 RepID=A0A078FF72_BRANA|nr:BnaA05g11930D [Brassica napus]
MAIEANNPINMNSMSSSLQRTGQWVFSQDIPTDVVVEVGEANFSLHKFMLVAKSNYIRKLIMESKDSDVTRIDLSDIPGGPEMFEKAAKFCYGVNFEITVQNVAALHCAAEFLQMTDKYCDNNLAGRTQDFLSQVALSSLSGAVVVLKSCEILLPISRDLGIVRRCVDVVGAKACNEAMFPCRTPPNWWTEELCILDVDFFTDVVASMKQRGLKPSSLASAIITYTERSLRDLFSDPENNDSEERSQQRDLVESIVSLLPSDKGLFPINFLCSLLRCAVFLEASLASKNELEKRISVVLEHVTVDDLLIPSFTYDGERLLDLDSVRRIISTFVEKEKNVGVFNGGDFNKGLFSASLQRVARTVDSYLAEIATYGELTISKFNAIANLVPKSARKSDDDLYRAIDIFLKAHPNLDEIEREKVCSSMDPLKLSYEARLHASQNKRLPVNIVLHALYYDQLKLRSGVEDKEGAVVVLPEAVATRGQVKADASLAKENEALRSELMKMKMYVSDLQKSGGAAGASSSNAPPSNKKSSKSTFFSSVSKKLGKLNPFRHGSKDTSNIDEDLAGVDITKPRRRRFSIS